ncbi:MAG: hypothetical protein QOC78_1216 [Solirubrobacteraceae bacterium]|jgi:hypothetical protein|nr:hypothetical protein [Solirubrobacteraceae bacterium]
MSEVLERGDLFFFYRPRVGADEVRDLSDVQRTFVILEPDGRTRYRRLIVGRKRLPRAESHEREWAFVAEVADDPEAMRDDIERKAYETRTRGPRVQPEARPAGEGRYAIVDHDGHTHLAYALELPREPGDVQRELGIAPQASYIVAVRNPDAPAPPGLGLPSGRRADFPPELRERFRGRRFAPLNPPDFLDFEGAEVVLIAAAADAARELGIDLDAEAERLEDADVFADLRLRPGEVPVEPLQTGEWR